MATRNVRLGGDAPIEIDIDDMSENGGSNRQLNVAARRRSADPPEASGVTATGRWDETSVLQVPAQPTGGAVWDESMIAFKTGGMGDEPDDDQHGSAVPVATASFQEVSVQEPSGMALSGSRNGSRNGSGTGSGSGSGSGGRYSSNKSPPVAAVAARRDPSADEDMARYNKKANVPMPAARARRSKMEEHAAGMAQTDVDSYDSKPAPATVSPPVSPRTSARSPPVSPRASAAGRTTQVNRSAAPTKAEMMAGEQLGAIPQNTPAPFRVQQQPRYSQQQPPYTQQQPREQPLTNNDDNASIKPDDASYKPSDDASARTPPAGDYLAVAHVVKDEPRESTGGESNNGLGQRQVYLLAGLICIFFILVIVAVVVALVMIGGPGPTPATPVPMVPTDAPIPVTDAPTVGPPTTAAPTMEPTGAPTTAPTESPTEEPSVAPSTAPSGEPTVAPTKAPTTMAPTDPPTPGPTSPPTPLPTMAATPRPTNRPTNRPTLRPTPAVTTASPTDPIAGTFPDNLPAWTKIALADAASPQARSLAWVEQHTRYSVMPEWKKVQLFAMVTFYYAMDGANWFDWGNRNWLSQSEDECDWGETGASANECNAEGRLTRLVLSGQGENPDYGATPPEVALLTSLERLELGVLYFFLPLTDILPTQLADLPVLRELMLPSSDIVGTIPTHLANFQQLTNLLLRTNELTGTIPTEIGLMTNLRYLNLYGNSLTGTIPTELGMLTMLEAFTIFTNDFTGTLPTNVCNLPMLGSLRLDCNFQFGCADDCTNFCNCYEE